MRAFAWYEILLHDSNRSYTLADDINRSVLRSSSQAMLAASKGAACFGKETIEEFIGAMVISPISHGHNSLP
jgi:hypothetical protein